MLDSCLSSKSRARPSEHLKGIQPLRKAARKTSEGKSADTSVALSAALRLQRWFRRDLWKFLWDKADVQTRYRIKVAGVVRIVEPLGQTYDFKARDLALMFISSGVATHPVTRRELIRPEMRRIAHKLPPRLRVLFNHTRTHQESAARAARQEDSLSSYLHAAAGASLDQAMCCAELDSDGADFEDMIGSYETAIMDICLQLPRTLRDLFRQHHQLLQQRKHCCDSARFDVLVMNLELWKRMYLDPDHTVVPYPAFVNWILEATK